MRHEKRILIEIGRDKGKTFIIREMAASKAEKWANRAILAVANSGANIDHVVGSGMAGLAMSGYKALFGIKEAIALELIGEMWSCIQISVPALPDGRDLVEDDTEEVGTRWLLEAEVFALHTGFSLAELKSQLISAAKIADSLTTPMSPEPSEPSSPAEGPALPN